MKELSLTKKRKWQHEHGQDCPRFLITLRRNGYYNTSIEMLCEKAMIRERRFLIILKQGEKLIKLIMEDGLCCDLKDD